MKTKLLTPILLLTSLLSFSQTNGWHQYHKGTQISNIATDASGNIHLATDSGYLKYNITTNEVEDYANLTSQSQPIGWCTSVKVNPVNNNVALSFPSGQGIAIYDGADYTVYNSSNSSISDFSSPEFHYTDSGLLYIFDKTDIKYQTFENGVFGAVQNLTFRPTAIIENLAGNLLYFAGLNSSGFSDGLYELDKTTNTFTHYTTSNSDLASNGVLCFFRDTNDLLYIGTARGVNTLDTMGNWATFQEPLPINPSIFYSVYSIDRFNDGTFLVNNSNPNSSEERGFSTVDFTTNTWTHFDSSVYCNNADQVRNMVLSNDMVFTYFRKFGASSEDSKLWSFDTSTNTCQEQNINHLNVTDLGSFGTTGLTLRESTSSEDEIQLLWTNNGGSDLKSIDLPTNGTFINGFPNAANLLTSTVALNGINPITIDDEAVLLVGDDDGIWFIDASNASTHIPHGLDLRMISLDIAFSLNNGAKSLGLIGGWNQTTFDYEVRIIEANGTITTNSDFNSSTIRLSGPTDFGIEFGGFVNTTSIEGQNSTVDFSATGQTDTGPFGIVNLNYTPETNSNATLSAPSVVYNDIIDEYVDYAPDLFYTDFDNDSQKEPSFQDTDNNVRTATWDVNTNSVSYTAYSPTQILGAVKETIINPKSQDFSPSNVFNSLVHLFGEQLKRDDDPQVGDPGFTGKRFHQVIFTPANPLTVNRMDTTLNTQVIPESVIENLPSDFHVLSINNYAYSDTHFATVLSTTYGLLFNTAIDYSSFVLDVDEVAGGDNLKLYPNPANNIVTVSAENITSVEVLDINGRNVLTSKSNTFSVKHLSNGIYIVKAIGEGNRIITKKLIKN